MNSTYSLRPIAAFGFTLVEMIVTIAIIGVLTTLLLSGVQSWRVSADSSKCVSNLRASGQAMLQYFQDNNMEFFPSDGWFAYPSTKAKPNSGMLDYFWTDPVSPTAKIADATFKRDTMLTCPAMKRKYPQFFPQALNWSFAINYYLLQKNPSRSFDHLPSSQRPLLDGAPQRMVNVSKPSAMWILTEAAVNGATLSYINDYMVAHPGNFMSTPHQGRQNVCFLDGHIESLSREDFLKPPNPQAFWGNRNLPETQ